MQDPTVAIQGWVPVIGLFVTLIAAIAPSVYNGWRADRNAKKAADAATAAAEQTKEVAKNLDVNNERTAKALSLIHGLVNGNLEQAKATIKRLEQELMEARGEVPPDTTA